jgi:NitT/TauT family transport system ATP-binding protein
MEVPVVSEIKNLLHVENVYKKYGPKLVLDNVDLSVAEGELCTVVGPSGCGKSTLLRMIVGQEKPSSGEILIFKEDVGVPDEHRGIVYQKYGLFPHLSVLENVVLGKKMSLSPWQWLNQKRQIQEEAMEYLKRMKLGDHGQKFPFELSGGMQQRVAIAQTLIMKPKIVLMDEPFGALDPGTREDLQIFLLELWENFKLTVFFVTHDLEEAVFLGTRIIVLSQYYTDDRGADFARGAKVVADYSLERTVNSTLVKSKPEFVDLVREIRRAGFEPKYKQHVTEFNLKHKDSFQTLTEEEHKK